MLRTIWRDGLSKETRDAQDVVQEAYVRALRRFKGFRGANARTWLVTIVRNTAYSRIRKDPFSIIR